ncbi:unnamed protein product [Paramecium sonneborni]|uniref:Ubiquitin-like protease family profile domain-containing protein n=1 Tax=Paramecium sonneborni TaxID=65129 RepID=A0A8S1RBR6_9CILI|nr:unnamed protein product [Paramecium sonneborni]
MQQNQNDQINDLNSYKVQIGKSLILRPGGNIFIIPTIFDNNLCQFYECKIYINQYNYISIPSNFESYQQNIEYTGFIDKVTFLPHGQGELNMNNFIRFSGQFLEGLADNICVVEEVSGIKKQYTYRCGQKHGPFFEKNENYETLGYYENNLLQGELICKDNQGVIQSQKFYHNNIQVNYNTQEYSNQIQQNTSRYLFFHKDYSINNYLFLGLNDGNWLNQLLIDYYLELVQDYYRCIYTDQEILLINTIMSQDIFSSQISNFSIGLNKTEKIEELLKQKYNRITIILNADRSHFITLVFQNNALYLLNSMNFINDQDILNKVAQMFNKPEQQIKTIILNVPQQQNCYDCGLYSIFNVLLQYQNIDKSVGEIDYNITTPQKITFLRQHIRNVLINDYSHIIPIYK